MTISQPPRDERLQQAGYVPAFEGADGNEDPAPEEVIHSTPLAPIGAAVADDCARVAAEGSVDQQTDAARRIGQLPLDFAGPETQLAEFGLATANAAALRTDAPANAATPNHPGDDAAPKIAQTENAVCPECSGSGKTGADLVCENCGGAGSIIQIAGDASRSA